MRESLIKDKKFAHVSIPRKVDVGQLYVRLYIVMSKQTSNIKYESIRMKLPEIF